MAEALTTEPTGGQLAGVRLAQAQGAQDIQSLQTAAQQSQTLLDENRKRLRDAEAAIRRAQKGQVISALFTLGGIGLGAALAAPAVAGAGASGAAGAAGGASVLAPGAGAATGALPGVGTSLVGSAGGPLSRLGLSTLGGARVGATAGNVLGSIIGGQQADPAFGQLLDIAQGVQEQRRLGQLQSPRSSVLDEAMRQLLELQQGQRTNPLVGATL